MFALPAPYHVICIDFIKSALNGKACTLNSLILLIILIEKLKKTVRPLVRGNYSTLRLNWTEHLIDFLITNIFNSINSIFNILFIILIYRLWILCFSIKYIPWHTIYLCKSKYNAFVHRRRQHFHYTHHRHKIQYIQM